MDPASRALVQTLPAGVRDTYAARSEHSNVPVSTLIHRRNGRRSREEQAQRQQYLSREEEKALVQFLLLMSNLGHPVRIKFIRLLAYSIARQRSTKTQPIKPPGKNWPKAFAERHPELQARKVKSIDWKRHENNVYGKIVEWFDIIGQVLQDPAVLPENVYNMDETGVMLSMLGSVKVLVGKDDRRNYRGGGVKRTMITAVECVSADGRALLPLIVWPASTHRSNWTTHETPGWHYAHSENGYNDSKINLEWLTRVFDPQTRARANGKPRVLICDGFGSHETLEILEFCLTNNIILCRLPSHTSHKLQPCDVGPFAPLKTAYRDQVERLNRGGIDIVGKEHFTYLYSPARDTALTKRNIRAGWAATGLYPFNPERVLKDIPRPPVEVIPEATLAGTSAADIVLQTPITPVTPVTAEALTSLHNVIKQDTNVPDETRGRIQKLANAAQISFAERALLKDRNRFLFKINNEAKARRSTRSIVLGKAKVMSFEDLEEAKVRRAEKDKAVAQKGQRGRKRKEPASEVLPPSNEVARTSGVIASDNSPATSWRIPVAKMY
ncbi:hypothetical protein CUC08_Gglean005686 [Alternaria sp. MG1]|nr:hypothetical protein CUC08_Gglean005686 [Alternaria sp. MG1]